MLLPILNQVKEITAGITALRMIDFDRGQLDHPHLYESILQPAVLVGLLPVSWQNLQHNHQQGQATFYTKTIVRLPQNHAYYADPQFQDFDTLGQDNITELLIEDIIHQAIIQLPTAIRTRTLQYVVHTFFVTEHHYDIALHYTLPPHYQPHKPASQGINVILNQL